MTTIDQASRSGIDERLDSRMSNTPILVDEEGRVFFDIWRPPPIVRRREVERFTVGIGQIGAPDFISHLIYGNSEKFWAIALFDDRIFNPLRDLEVGMELEAPNSLDVSAALLSSERPAE